MDVCFLFFRMNWCLLLFQMLWCVFIYDFNSGEQAFTLMLMFTFISGELMFGHFYFKIYDVCLLLIEMKLYLFTPISGIY